jgi:PAS domain S-box-containing protein
MKVERRKSKRQSNTILKILAIDDDLIFLKLLTELVETSMPGYKVITAQSAISGLDMAKIEQPNVILLDIIMPDIDGFEACRQILSNNETKNIPIIMMTGMRDSNFYSRSLVAGASAFITKPIANDELLSQIRVALRIRDEKEFLEKHIYDRTLKLNESEIKYAEIARTLRLMCDTVPDMIWAKNTSKQFIFVNKSICDNLLFAKDTNEPIGKTDEFFANRIKQTHSEDPCWHTFGQICQNSDQVILDTKQSCHFDEIGNVNGRFMFLSVNKAPIFDDDGNIVGIVGSGRDITDRKKIEETLILSEAKYKAIVEDQTELICRFAPNGEITFVNTAYCKYFDKQIESIIGKQFMELIPDISKEFVKNSFISINKDNQFNHYDNSIVLSNGEIRWLHWSDRAIFDKDFNIVEYQSIGFDITDRKHLEEKLLKSKLKYRAVLNNLQDGFYQTDINGNICFVSLSALELLGYNTRYELLGKPIRNYFVEPEKRDLLLQRLKDNGGRLYEQETEIINRNGEAITISLNVQLEYDDLGNITGTSGIFRDITESKRRLAEIFKLYNVVEGSQNALMIIERDGVISYANKAVLKIARAPEFVTVEEHVINRRVKSFLSFDNGRTINYICEIVEKTGKWFGEGYIFCSCANQERVPIDVMFSKITDGDKNYIVASFYDISERRKLENKIKEQSHMYEELQMEMTDLVEKMDTLNISKSNNLLQLEEAFTRSIEEFKHIEGGNRANAS